jgi:hypothetical protein
VIWGTLLGAGWDWFAKMGAPILAAFMVGQYIAGRNCEEDKLREEIGALRAQDEARERLLAISEERRLESERLMAADLTAYQRALKNATENDPELVKCRGLALPPSLRLKLAPPDDNSTR